MPLSPCGKRKPLFIALRHTIMLSAGIYLGSPATTLAQPEVIPGQRATASRQEEPRVPVANNLDWLPLEQLSEEQRASARPTCCGAYVDPERHYRDADLPPEEAPLRINSDETLSQGGIATMKGDIQVSQGYRQVRSNEATIDQDKRVVELDGDIIYREPGLLLTSDNAKVDMDSGQLEANNVKFVLHETGVRGQATKLRRPEEDKLAIDDALYTSCAPNNNDWQLNASDVEIDLTKQVATAHNVKLRVKDIPILYLPWIRYPLSDNRTSGLLFPTILTGNDNGLDVAQPIYLNLAPNYDATITPRYIQERGSMAEMEFRHLSSVTETLFSGGYLWDDDGGGESGETVPGDNRWTVGIDHKGGFGEHWNTLIDYTDVSDIDYFRDIDSATLAVGSDSHLNQQFKAGYNTAHWDFALQVQEFETLIVNGLEQYQQLPRFDADALYNLGDSDFVVTFDQNFVVFDHSEDKLLGSGTPLTTDNQNTTITGNRFRGDYSLAWDKEWLWGFFKPQIIGKYISYNLDAPLLNQTETNPDVFVPVATLDTGLFFERQAPWFDNHIQTFEPRFYYLNAQHEDQSAIPNFDTSELTFGYHQLFRDDRFSGGDRIGDTEQFTLGVTTRFINEHTGEETLRLSLGQVYYMDDRRVSLTGQEEELIRDNSDIAVELSSNFAKYWRVKSDLLMTDDIRTLNKGNLSINYNDGENTVVNFGYRYTRRENVLVGGNFVRADIDQALVSFALPVSDNWTFVGRYNQDMRTNEELEIFAGVEYASCCWKVSVVARRWVERDDNLIIDTDSLDHNNGLFLQIQFYGLAGVGKRVDDILTDGIYGYQPRDN